MNLKAIEARAKAATAGPWTVDIDPPFNEDPKSEMCFILHGICPERGYTKTAILIPGIGIEDGRFIAHAREDIPALTAEVRRLKAQLETEILRRDSLGETLDNVVADHKRDIARLADIKAKAKSILVHSYPGNSIGEGCIRTEYLDALATALEGE